MVHGPTLISRNYQFLGQNSISFFLNVLLYSGNSVLLK